MPMFYYLVRWPDVTSAHIALAYRTGEISGADVRRALVHSNPHLHLQVVVLGHLQVPDHEVLQ